MTKQTLGELISNLRKEKGITQKQLADQMKVPFKTVSNWEQNFACPDEAAISRLAELLGVSGKTLLVALDPELVKKNQQDLRIGLLLRVIPLIMGILLIVTGYLKIITLYSGIAMLSIGFLCLGIDKMRRRYHT